MQKFHWFNVLPKFLAKGASRKLSLFYNYDSLGTEKLGKNCVLRHKIGTSFIDALKKSSQVKW